MVPDALTVRWTRRALSGLAGIAEFVSANNPVAAQRLLQEIRSKAEILKSFPYLGREFSPSLGELTYRIQPDMIEILQVWHVARQR